MFVALLTSAATSSYLAVVCVGETPEACRDDIRWTDGNPAAELQPTETADVYLVPHRGTPPGLVYTVQPARTAFTGPTTAAELQP